MACRPYNTGRCLQLRLFNCPNFGVHFIFPILFVSNIKNSSNYLELSFFILIFANRYIMLNPKNYNK